MHQIDKKSWYKLSFYLNIVIFIIIAIAIALLITHTYTAGKIAASSSGGDFLSQHWIYVGADIAFLAVSLTYVFVQLFKYQRIIMRRSW